MHKFIAYSGRLLSGLYYL
jgi:hypothetical protein